MLVESVIANDRLRVVWLIHFGRAGLDLGGDREGEPHEIAKQVSDLGRLDCTFNPFDLAWAKGKRF